MDFEINIDDDILEEEISTAFVLLEVGADGKRESMLA